MHCRGLKEIASKICCIAQRTQLSACVCVCVCVQSLQSCPTLFHPINCSPQGSSIHGDFSRQEYWSGLLFSTPDSSVLNGDLNRWEVGQKEGVKERRDIYISICVHIYIHIQLIHFIVLQKLTQYCKAAIPQLKKSYLLINSFQLIHYFYTQFYFC